MKRLLYLSHGIILVTGPTGSGKTTSLYAALSYINSPDKNILTIEDPIEYQLDGIGQMQVNPKINLTFAGGLRSMPSAKVPPGGKKVEGRSRGLETFSAFVPPGGKMAKRRQ